MTEIQEILVKKALNTLSDLSFSLGQVNTTRISRRALDIEDQAIKETYRVIKAILENEES